MRFQSKDARARHALLIELGYEFVRHAAHGLIYRHDDHGAFAVPLTPSDHRSARNWLAQLKQRHPEAFAQRKSSRPRRRRRRAVSKPPQHLRMVGAIEPPPEPEIRIVEATACLGCGRPWLSDIDPSGRTCPRCGGRVVLPGKYVIEDGEGKAA